MNFGLTGTAFGIGFAVGLALEGYWDRLAFFVSARLALVNAQGELQGALSSVGGLTSVAAPPLLTSIFGYFTSPVAPVYFPGAAFFVASPLLALAALLLMQVRATPFPQPAE